MGRFRYDGMTSLLKRGLDFWWNDCHWKWFSPGLNVPSGGSVDGVTWGQAVFSDIMVAYYKENRTRSFSPFSLGCAGSQHPAAHRYPTWWTGDNFNNQLTKAVQQMVAGGYETFMPYVHPDCGGHHGGDSPEVYLRWIQFCAFGNIMRVHSDPWNDRRPWLFPEHYPQDPLSKLTEGIFKKFVKMRVALSPTLTSLAHAAAEDGMPLVRRLDFEFPKEPGSTRMDQFLLGRDILVAPIDPFNSTKMIMGRPVPVYNRSRLVWIPPGEWTDAFSGATVKGPKMLTRVDTPVDELPLYH